MNKGIVAITGASGLVGGALCSHFASQGYTVRALLRRLDATVAPGVTRVQCNLPGEIDPAALVGVDAVIHAAYPTMLRNLKHVAHINEAGTQRLLELARAAGVRRFVFVSTLSAHETAVSYYGRSKLRLEGLMDPACDLTIRPGLVLAASGGLFNRIRSTIARSRIIPVFGGGRQMLQTIHVEDLCAGFQRALELDVTGRIILAEREGLPFRDFLRLVGERMNRRVILVPLPIPPALMALRVVETLRVPLPVSSENLLGLKSMRFIESASDLATIGITVRGARESIVALLAR